MQGNFDLCNIKLLCNGDTIFQFDSKGIVTCTNALDG